MIKLCCKYLSAGYSWLCVLIMSTTHCWVNSHSVIAPECQGTLCLKHAWNLKFKWLQHLFRKLQLKCCKYLSALWFWLYVLIMSRTFYQSKLSLYSCLNVKWLELNSNPQQLSPKTNIEPLTSLSVVAWMSRNSLFEESKKSGV